MKCELEGHEYSLTRLDGEGVECLNFVNRNHSKDKPGTNNQEVLRVLIDRVKFLEKELRLGGNEKILYHLRMVVILHESRHLERLVERGKINPEKISVSSEDGHILIFK